eukprot:2155207-Pyramimonas_sp.AAC.1
MYWAPRPFQSAPESSESVRERFGTIYPGPGPARPGPPRAPRGRPEPPVLQGPTPRWVQCDVDGPPLPSVLVLLPPRPLASSYL